MNAKGEIMTSKLVAVILAVVVLIFLFYLLKKVVFAGDLFVGLFNAP